MMLDGVDYWRFMMINDNEIIPSPVHIRLHPPSMAPHMFASPTQLCFSWVVNMRGNALFKVDMFKGATNIYIYIHTYIHT